MIFSNIISLCHIASTSLASAVSPGEVRVTERNHDENPKQIRGVEGRLRAHRRSIASPNSPISVMVASVNQNALFMFPTFYPIVVVPIVTPTRNIIITKATSTTTSTLTKISITSTVVSTSTPSPSPTPTPIISTSTRTPTSTSLIINSIPITPTRTTIPTYSYNNPECVQGAGAILGNCNCTKSSLNFNPKNHFCDPSCPIDSYSQSLPFGMGTCICKFGLYDTRTNSCISICAPGFTPTGQPGNCWCAPPSILNMETLTCDLKCFGNLRRSINQLGYPVCA